MKFRRKTIPRIQSLGERVKRTRRKKRLSLVKMESLTKIRARYIDSLERGEYDKLPGDIYIKGFLRKIARVLHMDETKLIELYQFETLGVERKKRTLDVMKGIPEAKFIVTPKIIFAFFSMLILLIVGGYFWYQISGFAAAPKLDIQKPAKEDFTTKSSEITIAGNTDPGTSVTINDQIVPVDLEGHFTEIIKLKEGLNQIIISAKNKIGKEESRTIKVLSKGPLQNSKILGVKNQNKLFLILKVGPASSWISVDVDGKNIYKGIMVANTSQEFVAQKEIILTSGNAGNTHVYLNSKDLGILGNNGETVSEIKYDLKTLNSILKGEYEQNGPVSSS